VYIPAPHYVQTRGRISPEGLHFIHLGTTSQEEVLLRLGEPDAVARESTVFAYRSWWVRGYGATQGYVGSDIGEEVLLIAFADDRTVARYDIMKAPVLFSEGIWTSRRLPVAAWRRARLWGGGPGFWSLPYSYMERW
jgi:hypothetical protein